MFTASRVKLLQLNILKALTLPLKKGPVSTKLEILSYMPQFLRNKTLPSKLH